ncbi:uncharacterized protein LOC127257880 [Andrographis paniculata]|uniref:uncharacterized protein LOC127257880 n=1 Tax=Andrographis paniculata TaxID=175694 RepID=UPI0021E88333|nr:uncharacterized protein LOC127257880 [Andrographis paniculata]
MPTFTAIALDRLIEPGATKSMVLSQDSNDSMLDRRHSAPNTLKDRETDPPSLKPERRPSDVPKPKLGRGVSVPPNSKTDLVVLAGSKQKLDRRNSLPPPTASLVEKKHHWTQISPALYATPESTPLPDSPSSFPPSPYIINHKRRGPRLMKSFSEEDVAAREPAARDEVNVDEGWDAAEKGVANASKDDTCVPSMVMEPTKLPSVEDPKEEHLNGLCVDNHEISDVQNGLQGENGMLKPVAVHLHLEGEDDTFVDPQDSVSARSISENEGFAWDERFLKSMTPMAEFYDAWEELSETGSHLSMRDIETESREIRLCLLAEIEKRKQAEETLQNMRSQWQRIREQLSHVGLTLPLDPTSQPVGEQPVAIAADLCQQVYIARFVSNTIGRGIAKAEVEMEMQAQIDLKNIEIARLWDRLHYYEAVNQEMSQRNQEVVEMSRRLRQKRKRRQRWAWGSIAAAISIGSAVLAYSYFKGGKESSSPSKIEPKPK